MVLSRLLHQLLILLLLKLVVHLGAAALDECKIMWLLSFWCLVNLLVLTVSSSQLGACAVCLVQRQRGSPRIKPSIGERRDEQALLRLAIGRGEAR